MARLILKSPFIKGGGKAGRYVKYIGIRKGIELLPSGYAEYMSACLRSHGLFGDEEHVDLKKITAELDACEKNVWTHIVSLKREDAARLGYDNAKAWRNLIRAHRNDIAAAMNIPPNDFRWCAAFHDEGEHPHIHMMAWSAGDAPGYLSKAGIKQIKSDLTNDIFRQEMLHTYEQKSQFRDELVAEARRTMLELADEMKQGVCEHPEVEQLMLTLSRDLKNVKSKKQYGYLPKPLKKQVDEIVDQMAQLPSVQECYKKWLELQQQVNEFYSGKPVEQVPLSQQKEFRAIHNAVVQAAVQMGQLTLEDKAMEHNGEPDDVFWHSDSCRQIWSVLCDDSLPLEMKDEGVARLRSKAESGEPLAQLLLGRLYRDGPMLTPDWVEARYWFERAAHTLPDAQYALGKLLLTNDPEVHDREQGLRWLTQAAENGHDFAAYRLGKELLKDGKVDEALPWLKESAEADNPYAEYLLGKLLRERAAIPQDKKQAIYWLGQAAAQGHTYAQLLLERQNGSSLPSAILAVNGLLQQMGRIFQDNVKAMDSTRSQHTDHKLRRKIQEKKIAMGHKADDHEEQGYVGPAM